MTNEKKIVKEIHPYWNELIDYVESNGGYLRLNIRFKDGIPIEADDIKKQVRFDLNYKNRKKT